MKTVNKFVLIVFLIVVLTLLIFSQFSIRPTLEIEFCIDGNITKIPNLVYLIGAKKTYALNVNSKNINLYDIEPGKYFIGYMDNNQFIHSVYEIKFLFDPITMQPLESRRVQNTFKINKNKNFKLEIHIIQGNIDSYIESDISLSLKNIDFTRFNYFIKQNATFVNNYDKNYKKNFSYIAEPNLEFEMNGDSGSAADEPCAREEIVNIEKHCTLFDGATIVNINKAYMCYLGMAEGVPRGTEGIGTKDSSGRWICGKCIILSQGAIVTNFDSKCIDGKCHTTIDLDLKLKFKSYIWDKDDMCNTLKGREERCGLENKIFWFSDVKNCLCEYNATIAHEKNHQDLWLQYINKFKAMTCDHIFQYVSEPMRCNCDNDNDNNEYCKKYDVGNLTMQVENALAEIYNQDQGNLQEDDCYKVEQKSFKDCVRCR